jgi:hypothetical protein
MQILIEITAHIILEKTMGQARARKQEIAELKRHGRLIDTPRFDQPVIFRAGDTMWITANAEFGGWVEAAYRIAEPPAAQREFARLALIAERSGVRERECQQWFDLQLKHYADTATKVAWEPPIVFAQSHK